MKVPTDPHILLSYINTKLRDEYRNLDDLCKSLGLERDHIETALSSIDYIYSHNSNRFTASI